MMSNLALAAPGGRGPVVGLRAVAAAVVLSVLLFGFPAVAQANLSWSTPVSIDTGNSLTGVACPSVRQCTAVGGMDEVTFNPASPGSPTVTPIAPGASLNSVACPSVSQCAAIVDGVGEVTFNPLSPGIPAPVVIDAGHALYSVACPSVNQCTAAVDGPQELTFDPASPGTPTPITVGTSPFKGLACASVSQCTAVGPRCADRHGDARQPRGRGARGGEA